MKKLICILFSCIFLTACTTVLVSCNKETPATDTTACVTEQTTDLSQTEAQQSETTTAVADETTEQITAPPETTEQLNISIEVVHADGSSKIFPLTTNCTNLADALTTSGIAQGKDGQYGFTIYTVDGVTADFVSSNTYWEISVNGESAQTGASGIELENGGIYTLTFSVYS